jgi:multidrug transporter EmrE-like cation transporter
MSLLSALLIATGVLLNTAAQLLLKAGTNAVGSFAFTLDTALSTALRLAFNPYILGGLSCYAISLVVWLMALSRTEVSVAYPMLSIGFALNAAIAWWWLGEAISVQRVVGVSIIIVGVFLVARS